MEKKIDEEKKISIENLRNFVIEEESIFLIFQFHTWKSL